MSAEVENSRLTAGLLTSPVDDTAPLDPLQRAGYADLIDSLRGLQDAVAGAAPPGSDARSAARQIDVITAALSLHSADERSQMFNRLPEFPGHGQTFTPRFEVEHLGPHQVIASVTFTRYNLGGGAAAHGGAVALLFDSLMGRLVNLGSRPRARTVHLGIDYRRTTPLDVPLRVECEIEIRRGRKRVAHGVLSDADEVCAEARGIFVELRPGQK